MIIGELRFRKDFQYENTLFFKIMDFENFNAHYLFHTGNDADYVPDHWFSLYRHLSAYILEQSTKYTDSIAEQVNSNA